jgi:streptomycin 6-kinase
LNLPKPFVTNIRAIYGRDGETWLAGISKRVETLAGTWNFRDVRIVPNLTFNFIATVTRNADNQTAVLKICPTGRSLQPEVQWLEHYDNVAVTVFAFDQNQDAFLMEYCNPGTSLKDFLDQNGDEAATRELCRVMKKIQKKHGHESSFRHLSELIPDLQSLKGVAEPPLFSKAEALFSELTSDRSGDILLHGDLHHDNILLHHTDWKVIDPHGYIGDPVAETGVLMYNPVGGLPTGTALASLIDRRIGVLSEELGYDRKRIQAWCFCITMLSAAWNVEDFGSQAKVELEIAETIDNMTY